MGVENQGAPVFTIEGNAGAISSRASTVRTRSSDYSEIARALDSISTEGWVGRAADRFRERFSVEPQRWQEASGGFSSAAGALDSYADNLTHAQDSAAACRALYEEGNRVTEQARAAYEAEVARGMQEKAAWEAVNGLGTFAVTIAPFVDPGEPMRQDAINTFNQTVASLDECAQACAQTIRSACEFAPAKRNWLESGLAFVGGILVGAGEAVGDLLNLITGPQGFMLDSLTKLATGDLTPDEAVAKLQLPLDDVSAMLSALKKDPLEFGKQIGKGVLDWDAWADDPARAVGHLVPDVAIALLTAGSGTALTKGTSTAGHALNSLDDIGDGARALRGLDIVQVTVRGRWTSWTILATVLERSTRPMIFPTHHALLVCLIMQMTCRIPQGESEVPMIWLTAPGQLIQPTMPSMWLTTSYQPTTSSRYPSSKISPTRILAPPSVKASQSKSGKMRWRIQWTERGVTP